MDLYQEVTNRMHFWKKSLMMISGRMKNELSRFRYKDQLY